MSRKKVEELRSARWFMSSDIRGFAHRQRTQQMGMRREEFMGKPVIGIINTWSDISPCHAHLRDRAEAVKRGVWQAGGYPVELPALSVGEVMVKPTTMLYRNFLAMEVEELLRSHPIDGCVLLGGCDKSTPGMLMGAFCRRSSVRPDPCPTAVGAAKRPAPGRIPRSTSTSCEPVKFPKQTGSISRRA